MKDHEKVENANTERKPRMQTTVSDTLLAQSLPVSANFPVGGNNTGSRCYRLCLGLLCLLAAITVLCIRETSYRPVVPS
ncbi:hypothetical protein MHYP_G00249060 [Metynnis hypsauchen]